MIIFSRTILIISVPLLIGTSWEPIPEVYKESVKVAIENGSLKDCNKIATTKENDWIRNICVERIFFNKDTKKYCTQMSKKGQDYARCIGVVAYKSKDKKLCDEFPDDDAQSSPHTVCIFTYQLFNKSLTDFQDHPVKNDSESKKSRHHTPESEKKAN